MSDTPEIDSIIVQRLCIHKRDGSIQHMELIDAEVARKLKRERDEARKHLRDANRGAEINAHINQKFAQQLIDAREKIKNQAERICVLEGAANHACGTPLTRALRERDEAREVLNEIANASHFDNIGNWARNEAKKALEGLYDKLKS